jgi:hypothetical protein
LDQDILRQQMREKYTYKLHDVCIFGGWSLVVTSDGGRFTKGNITRVHCICRYRILLLYAIYRVLCRFVLELKEEWFILLWWIMLLTNRIVHYYQHIQYFICIKRNFTSDSIKYWQSWRLCQRLHMTIEKKKKKKTIDKGYLRVS